MSMASTISGTMCSASDWASCSTLLPIGLGLMLAPRHCDIPVIFSPRAGAGGTSIGYRRDGRGMRDSRGGTVEFERYEDGVPSWVDLGSTDLAKSREFYGALFGWNCPEGPPEAGGYSVCDLGGKTVAGLGPVMNPDMPTVWMTYVNVDSADDTVAKVTANGGTVFMPPMDVMDAGRMAVFADPLGRRHRPLAAQPAHRRPAGQRARHLLLERAHHDGPRRRRRPSTGRCSGGAPRTRALPGDRPRTPSGSSAGRSIGGMMLKTAEMPADMPPNWGVYFAVADTDATVAKAQELGASVFMGRPTSSPGGSPSWPTTSAPCSTSCSSRGSGNRWNAAASVGPATRAASPFSAAPPAGPPASRRRGSGCSWRSTTG